MSGATFDVMSKRCDECLFGPDKIVSNARRAQILRDLKRKDSYFICHKASIVGREICCAGDWEQNGGGQLGRIAGRLGVVRMVDESELKRDGGPADDWHKPGKLT